MLTEFKRFIGFDRSTTTTREKAVAALTGGISIYLMLLAGQCLTSHISGLSHYTLLLPIAASTVLLFAVPHGALSQPWPLIGGHTLSACVGVACAQTMTDPFLAAACTLAGSTLLMVFLRCLHPPGAATGLTAILGGEQIISLGYQFILFPVLFSAVVSVLLAIVINYPFRWRRYPAHLFYRQQPVHNASTDTEQNKMSFEDFLTAVAQHDLFVDITEESWQEIFELAQQPALQNEPPVRRVRLCASNNNTPLTGAPQIFLQDAANDYSLCVRR